MNMADVNRRQMIFALAGASVVVAGGRSFAQQPPIRENVDIVIIKTIESMIPSIPKVQVREVRYKPGGRTASAAMGNDMVCECTEGSLEVSVDGKPAAAMNKGDMWTCRKGMAEASTNKGTTPAVMRVIDLLPA
jgi:quercetin dioxygenase-like cupin family protein